MLSTISGRKATSVDKKKKKRKKKIKQKQIKAIEKDKGWQRRNEKFTRAIQSHVRVAREIVIIIDSVGADVTSFRYSNSIA